MRCGVRFWVFLALALGVTASLHAQDPADPEAGVSQDKIPMRTLHVYMDLIQLPVLVLDSEQDPMKPIDASYFRASLDSGPLFRPRHVRQEGDDPITLAIVLDANTEPNAMPSIGKALASLVPGSLHSNDHVSLLVLRCGLVRTLQDVPANAVLLQDAAERGLKPWTERRQLKHPPPCATNVGLWDAMAFAAKEISSLPGRRVLLTVSSGIDSGSRTAWTDLRSFAQEKGIAIFGYSTRRDAAANYIGGRGRPATFVPRGDADSDRFDSICQLTGGMVMHLDPSYMPRQLTRFMGLVRGRYILEFTRPRNEQPGEHNIVVTIPQKNPNAFIRPSGVTIMRVAAEGNDEDTIQTDKSDAPEIGPRRPIRPK